MLSKLLLALFVVGVACLPLLFPEIQQFARSMMLSFTAGSPAAGPSGVRVWSPEVLKKYDGSDPSLPLLLVVLGEVYDVTVGAKFYGKGESYNIFLGQDASRSFHSGVWDKAEADIRDLSPMAAEAVTGWRSFYRKSDKYIFAGVVEGLYYDANGNPTQALHDVDQLEQQAGDANAYEAELLKRFPQCNMASVTALKKTDINCPSRPEDNGAKRVPRMLYWTHRGSNAETKRCGCLTMDEIGAPRQMPPTMRSEPYPGCPPEESSCVIKHQ